MCASKADRWRELGKGKAQIWQVEIRIPQHFYHEHNRKWDKTEIKLIRRLITEFRREMEQQGCVIRTYLVRA